MFDGTIVTREASDEKGILVRHGMKIILRRTLDMEAATQFWTGKCDNRGVVDCSVLRPSDKQNHRARHNKEVIMPLSDAARIPPAVGQLINFRLDEISFSNSKGEEQTSQKLVLEYTRLDGSMFDGLSFWLPKGWPNTHGPSSAIGRWLAHAASVQPEKDFAASTTKAIVEEMFGQYHCLECRDDLVQTGRGDNRRMLHTPTALFASREEAEEWWNQYGVAELDTGNLASEAAEGGDVADVYVEAARGMLEKGLDQETIVARLKLAGCTKASMAILKASF